MGVDLGKGKSVRLAKTPITRAIARWSSDADYDMLAEVLFRDGHTETVSMFGVKGDRYTYSDQVANGAVRHLGDVGNAAGRKGTAEEIIEVQSLRDDIVAVLVYAYSAQANGAGSFRKHRVTLEVSNGVDDPVIIRANNASWNPCVYTCIPAIIINRGDHVEVKALKRYSWWFSERRPRLLPNLRVKRGGGAENAFKR